jgi:hypothetical protein
VLTLSSTTASSSAVGAAPPEGLLIGHIQAHIRKGEAAKERADKNREKAEQHFIAAGRYLTMLKVTYAPTWSHWEALLRVKVKLSTGRASELMAIASGKKSVQKVRDATTQRVRALRADRGVFVTNQCNEEVEGPSSVASVPPSGALTRGPLVSDSKNDANLLIDVLAGSTPAVRGTAVELVVQGSRQFQFEQVRDAVADLYQRLSRAGQ